MRTRYSRVNHNLQLVQVCCSEVAGLEMQTHKNMDTHSQNNLFFYLTLPAFLIHILTNPNTPKQERMTQASCVAGRVLFLTHTQAGEY